MKSPPVIVMEELGQERFREPDYMHMHMHGAEVEVGGIRGTQSGHGSYREHGTYRGEQGVAKEHVAVEQAELKVEARRRRLWRRPSWRRRRRRSGEQDPMSTRRCCLRDGRRSSGARYREHRWQVRARVGRAEADDGHGERELHLKWRARGAASEPQAPRGRLAPRCGISELPAQRAVTKIAGSAQFGRLPCPEFVV